MAIESIKPAIAGYKIPRQWISQDHPSTTERQRVQERGSQGFQRTLKLRSSGYQHIEQIMVTEEYRHY